MDRDWAVQQIDRYVGLLDELKPMIEQYKKQWWDGWKNSGVAYFGSGPDDQESLKELDARHREAVASIEPIVERIIEQIDRELLLSLRDADSFVDRQTAAQRARALILQDEQLTDKLGPSIPTAGIGTLHHEVSAVAAPFWDNEQYREAVNVAARAINAKLQRKVGRKDVSEADLARQAFSLEEPRESAPRLRFPGTSKDDDPRTWRSRHQGAMEFGAGLFLAIRNVETHADPQAPDLDPGYAIDCLASLSLFARWLDETRVVGPTPK